MSKVKVTLRSYGNTYTVEGRTVQSAVRRSLGVNVNPRPFAETDPALQDYVQRWRSGSWAEGDQPWGVAINTMMEAYGTTRPDQNLRAIIVAVDGV